MDEMNVEEVGALIFGLDLAERDYAVLDSINCHRFMRADQIRRLHFANLGSDLSRARTTQRVLKRLSELGLVRQLERRVGGDKRGSAGSVWHLGPLGIRLMKRSGRSVSRPHIDGKPEFLKHMLAIAEAHVELVEASRAGRFELLDVKIETESWRTFPDPLGAPLKVRPDLFAVTATREYESHRFIEVDRATESLTRIVNKCERYQMYFESGIEQHAHGVFPAVLWVVPHEARAVAMRAAIGRSKGLSQQLFTVVTGQQFIAEIDGSKS